MPQGLWAHQLLAPPLGFESAGAREFAFLPFPGDAAAAGPGTALWEPLGLEHLLEEMVTWESFKKNGLKLLSY